MSRSDAGASLARRTTLELGGPARHLVEVTHPEDLHQVRAWSLVRGLSIRFLGGGSNLVVADSGVPDLVAAWSPEAARGAVRTEPDGTVDAGAWLSWDHLVDTTVREGFQGLETLSGIPGQVGAAPIQNIGAYGGELSEVLVEVEVYDLLTGRPETWPARRLELGYRSSWLKHQGKGRYVVSRVRLRLRPEARPPLRYRDLQVRLEGRLHPDSRRALHQVRQTVLQIRDQKGMLWQDPQTRLRSAGSFFMNPVVDSAHLAWVQAEADRMGHGVQVPAHPVPQGHKLSAAWLIQATGWEKGVHWGGVGVSPLHVLALVNRGGGTTSELLGLAAELRSSVMDRFGVDLRMEPRAWGFHPDDPQLRAAGGSAEPAFDPAGS